MKHLFLVALTFFLTSTLCFSSPMVIEKVERVDAAVSHHAFLPPANGAVPARGVPFTNSAGLSMTRISDVLDPSGGANNPQAWNGLPNAGLTNGYSLYSAENRTGEYVLAFGVTSFSVLYRLSDCKTLGIVWSKSGAAIGDKAEVRWSRLPNESPTIIYYHLGSILYKQDALIGKTSEQIVKDFGVGFATPKDNNEISDDGRYLVIHLLDDSIQVFDLLNKVALPGHFRSRVSGINVSPDSQWVKFMEPYSPAAYCHLSDFANGEMTSHPLYRSTPGGHGAFGYNAKGELVDIYQNNKNDWFETYNPATQEICKIIYYGECGWGMSQHIARMPMATKGWALVSTYVTTDTAWSYNQLFMLELKPLQNADGTTVADKDRPRIWRLGHTQGNYGGPGLSGSDAYKNKWYFCEAFASISMTGQNVYVGSNWRGNDNIEIYSLRLPSGWHDTLGGNAPLPTPAPTPSPLPTASPSPIVPNTAYWPDGYKVRLANRLGAVNLDGPATATATRITPTPTPTPAPTLAAPVTVYASAAQYHYDSKQSLGDTTSNNYVLICSFAPEANSSNADTGMLLQFDLSGIAGQFKKATLVLTHFPTTEFSAHPTGREGIPIRRISGPAFTPAYPLHNPPTSNEDCNGASWQFRIQTTGTTQRWSTAPSAAAVANSRITGDLSTAMDAITSNTPRLNFAVLGTTSAVDVTGIVKGAIGGTLQIAIDAMSCTSPDRFGTQANPANRSFRVRQAIYGAGAVDKTKWPKVTLEY